MSRSEIGITQIYKKYEKKMNQTRKPLFFIDLFNKFRIQLFDSRILENMYKLKYRMSVFNRDYFMYIDHKGFLYLEETEPKNFTSCIKDARFFQFFYKNLKQNKTGRHNDYRFVSKCWGEFNFVKTQSTPIIYNDIQLIDNQWRIIAQNGYQENFDANQLFIKDNLLYYKVSLNDLEFGILSTDLAIKLGDNINESNTFKWDNNIYQL